MKKWITFLLAACMVANSFAGSISRGGGSFGRSVSSSPARSIGMSRPSVQRPSTSPRYAPSYTQPRPTTTPHYSAPAPSPMTGAAHAPSAGPSLGGMFASSLGGSLLGSWIGSSLGNSHGGGTTVVNNGGAGGAPGAALAGGPGAGGPMVIQQAAEPFSLAGFLWNVLVCIVLAAVIGGVLYLLWGLIKGKRREQQLLAAAEAQDLPFSPVGRFLELQRAFAAKDTTAIRAYSGPDMVDQLLNDLPDEVSQMTLTSVRYEVVDIGSRVVSIHFRAFDTSDNSDLSEVWHFIKSGSSWLLNGIEVDA